MRAGCRDSRLRPRDQMGLSVSETLTVYVPAPGSRLRKEVVRDGAGMVGSEVQGTGRIRVDFEGDVDTFPTLGA